MQPVFSTLKVCWCGGSIGSFGGLMVVQQTVVQKKKDSYLPGDQQNSFEKQQPATDRF
jgi:hypothetical protein